MFLLIVVISRVRRHEPKPSRTVKAGVPGPPLTIPHGVLGIPDGYFFHLCHTWAAREAGEDARVGVDSFVANLFGSEIEHIEVMQLNRWVRQGQKLMTVSGAGVSLEFLSPVEGAVKELNENALRNPALVASDPYRCGWIAVLKAPDITTDQKNLLQGPTAKLWLRNCIARLNEIVAQCSPALAQDGGLPAQGLLRRVSPELQGKLVKEFFLTEPIPREQVLTAR
jgi:glycine cleavage system H protein